MKNIFGWFKESQELKMILGSIAQKTRTKT